MIEEPTLEGRTCATIFLIIISNCLIKIKDDVLASAVHILKLERYREDQHGPCARMTRKIVKRSTFFVRTISMFNFTKEFFSFLNLFIVFLHIFITPDFQILLITHSRVRDQQKSIYLLKFLHTYLNANRYKYSDQND